MVLCLVEEVKLLAKQKADFACQKITPQVFPEMEMKEMTVGPMKSKQNKNLFTTQCALQAAEEIIDA